MVEWGRRASLFPADVPFLAALKRERSSDSTLATAHPHGEIPTRQRAPSKAAIVRPASGPVIAARGSCRFGATVGPFATCPCVLRRFGALWRKIPATPLALPRPFYLIGKRSRAMLVLPEQSGNRERAGQHRPHLEPSIVDAAVLA